jgi:16S rRNA processing protein RimM
MKQEDCYFIGHISRKHGYKGDLLIKLDVDNPIRYKNLESVFVEIKGKLVPFFLSYCKLNQKGFLHVHFEGVDNDSMATKLCKSGLYLPLSFLPPLSGNKFYYHEIEGYKVFDNRYGELGIVNNVVNQKIQPLFSIDNSGVEILVPINDEILVSLDREKKELLLDCPQGLIEVYLNKDENV